MFGANAFHLSASGIRFEIESETLADVCFDRAASPADEGDAEVKSEPVQWADVAHELRLLCLLGRVLVVTGSGNQLRIHGGDSFLWHAKPGAVKSVRGRRMGESRESGGIAARDRAACWVGDLGQANTERSAEAA